MQDGLALLGRLTFPLSMFAYPFYLLNRSPGKQGSHYDPKTDLFSDIEGPMVSPECDPRRATASSPLDKDGCLCAAPARLPTGS